MLYSNNLEEYHDLWYQNCRSSSNIRKESQPWWEASSQSFTTLTSTAPVLSRGLYPELKILWMLLICKYKSNLLFSTKQQGPQANRPAPPAGRKQLTTRERLPSLTAQLIALHLDSAEKLLLHSQRAKPPSSAAQLSGSKELRAGLLRLALLTPCFSGSIWFGRIHHYYFLLFHFHLLHFSLSLFCCFQILGEKAFYFFLFFFHLNTANRGHPPKITRKLRFGLE